MKIIFLMLSGCLLFAEERLSAKITVPDLGDVRLAEVLESEEFDNISGKSGQLWLVYLDDNMIGNVWGHKLAMNFEPLTSSCRIWVYHRSSGSSGIIGYYTISESEVSPLNAIEVNPGDGGTDLGNKVYDAVFSDSITFASEEASHQVRPVIQP